MVPTTIIEITPTRIDCVNELINTVVNMNPKTKKAMIRTEIIILTKYLGPQGGGTEVIQQGTSASYRSYH